MSIFESHSMYCSCGERLTVRIARSVNAGRMPQAREDILRGEFQQYMCGRCGSRGVAESTFYYTDFGKGMVYRVAPRGDRHEWRPSSRRLRDAVDELRKAPSDIAERPLQARVVFGLDELREKLVIADAELDDRDVEVLKVIVMQLHPVLRRRPRLRLSLIEVRARHFVFRAAYEHHLDRFEILVSRAEAEGLLRATEGGASLHRRVARVAFPSMDADGVVAGMRSLDGGETADGAGVGESESGSDGDHEPDFWVNMWRWSPQPGGLAELKRLAALADTLQLADFESSGFVEMVRALPPGDHLPPWAKAALQVLMNRAEAVGAQRAQQLMTNKRFDLVLADDWIVNDDASDIGRIWRQLEKLPSVHVEGLTTIRELAAGIVDGTFDPASKDLRVNSALLTSPTRFEQVLRHEVGHSVHESNKVCIDRGLRERFGWREFDPKVPEQCREWVGMLTDIGRLSPEEFSLVQETLISLVGPGEQLSSGAVPDLAGDHPWMREGFGPRLVFECMSGEYYKNSDRWHKSNDGKQSFFLNYYYRSLGVVSTSALAIAGAIDSRVAAMSSREYFAELYAACFDPALKGRLPADVLDWMGTCAVLPEE